MAAARDGEGGTTGGRWTPRRRAALLLRTSVWLIPLLASVGAAIAAANLLPPAITVGGHIAWWAAVLGASGTALVLTDRALRRTLPLAALLDVSLAFPHGPPSRFAVLRRVRSLDELQARIRDGERDAAQVATDLLALVLALDEHDRATRGHSERVRLYAELVGEELDLDEDELDRLRWAALLHDIGKLTVPAEILNKDSQLAGDEWARIRRHPAEGARLVEPLSGWLGTWTGAIEHHHEHVDGSGYPYGLEGQRIALGGRIVAVADAFETMTAARSYKRPLTVAEARRELVASSGTHFDEGIVRAFLNLSIPRLRHVAGWAAWIASMPGLSFLRRLPRTAGTGMVAAASIGVLAAAGPIAPGGPPTAPAEEIAAPATSGAERATDDERDPTVLAEEAPTPPSERDGARDVTSHDDRETGQDEGVGEGADGEDRADPDGSSRDGDVPPDDGTSRGDEPSSTEDTSRDDDGSPGQGDPDEDSDGDDDGSDQDDGASGEEPPEDEDDEPAESRRDTRQVGHDDATVLRELYLHSAPSHATLRHDVLPLDTQAPVRASLLNYDTDVDDDPGLRLRPTDRGRAEDRVLHRQRWAVDLGEPTTLAGRMSLTVWVMPADASGPTVETGAYVDHCARSFTDCRAVTDGSHRVQGRPGEWTEVQVPLPLGGALMVDDRVLVLTLIAGAGSDGDVIIAFDTTAHPAALRVDAGVIASPDVPGTGPSTRGQEP